MAVCLHEHDFIVVWYKCLSYVPIRDLDYYVSFGGPRLWLYVWLILHRDRHNVFCWCLWATNVVDPDQTPYITHSLWSAPTIFVWLLFFPFHVDPFIQCSFLWNRSFSFSLFYNFLFSFTTLYFFSSYLIYNADNLYPDIYVMSSAK